ncbi:MAG: conjugal transfer protein TraN [Alphaproteobacteria bacterium]|nr:conjugal transfer protein TraN [Alphaproteobacteria bacterium]
MTERIETSGDRWAVVVDRLTRIVRLLTWSAMFALVCLMLWVVSGMAARADSGAEDPKVAARAIGNAGNAAARTVARDSSSAADVPGYAGTNLPERAIGASRLRDEGRTRLADRNDPGAAAGRAVVRGATSRPSRPVAASDPLVRRSETVAASPQSPVHGAGGLASGSASPCGADLRDAEDGGACGSVRYCVGAGCETVSPQANAGFANAATRLNMALELGGEEFDRRDMRFFKGRRRACHIKLFGLANCCKNSGALVGLGNCSASERELAKERNAGNTHYLGRYCSKRTFFGACIRRSRAWCVFGSKLGRILQQQGRAQLGIGWSSCRGFTVAEIESIDFASLDLSEFTEDLMDGSRKPAVSLPDAGDTGEVMRTRIHDFYRREQ